MCVCFGLKGWWKMQKADILFMQFIERKSHQSCYYVPHSTHTIQWNESWAQNTCWFIRDEFYYCDFLQQLHNSLSFVFKCELQCATQQTIWGFILIASMQFSFTSYYSILILQHFHNYNTVISYIHMRNNYIHFFS